MNAMFLKFPLKTKWNILFHYIDHLSHSRDDFEKFLFNFDQLVPNIITRHRQFVLITGELMQGHQSGGEMTKLLLRVFKLNHSLPLVE